MTFLLTNCLKITTVLIDGLFTLHWLAFLSDFNSSAAVGKASVTRMDTHCCSTFDA
ncbi:MAG: hypothetical protein AAGI54_07705 [Planctomycetota bacterium]